MRPVVCVCVRTHEGMTVAIQRAIQQLAYSMAMSEPQESAENQYLGHRLLFTLENLRSHTRKALITKII